jgi:hypothetical protein
MLQYLPGLEEINLVPRIGLDMFDGDEDANYCYLMLDGYFKEEAKIDRRRPRETAICLHDYRRRKTRSDWEHFDDELVDWPFVKEMMGGE